MEQLISRLNSIPNSYFEFVDSIVDYADNNDSHLSILMDYLDHNPSATPSEIIRFISHQPDFFEDDAPVDIDSLVG